MKLPGIIRITRPANAMVAGFAAILGYLIAAGSVVPGVLLLLAIVFLVTAGGNTINDYVDADIDRVNRPGRPIPSGEVSPHVVWYEASLLFAAGVSLSFFTNPLCLAIAVFNSLLLIAYAYWLKRTIFLGNLVVAYLSGSIFIFGGAYLGPEGALTVVPISVITFSAMISRELLKTAEDVEGDAKAGARTVPVRYGMRATVLLSLAAAVLAVAASLYPLTWWGWPYLAGIVPVDLLILAGALLPVRCKDAGCVRKTKATSLLKIGMFAALLVFLAAAFVA